MYLQSSIFFEYELHLLSTVLVILSAYLVVRVWATRVALLKLRESAGRIGRGDLSISDGVEGPREIRDLARAMSKMARQLDDRLSTVIAQSNEQEALLSSMVEGVLAVDPEERIISINRAACEMLHVTTASVLGKSVQEMVRNTELQRIVEKTLEDKVEGQGEVLLRVAGKRTDAEPSMTERFVEFQTAVLQNAQGKRIGAVLVLHDVTQLRKLESMRRDFVSNVSHEVKTPVSAIKAAVETLQDDRGASEEDTKRFLKMIQRQADRLAAIVDDLLSLARIEETSEVVSDELNPHRVRPILTGSVETCSAAAQEKDVQLVIVCGDELSASVNAPLLEQSVTNLVDNAIKYTQPKTRVEIRADVIEYVETGPLAGQKVVEISVADEGRGIEAVHLPRLFERFYRTDRSRSREMGGTGLGLSIVKHIAEAHGGEVGVESVVGTGSRFWLRVAYIPADEVTLNFEPDSDSESLGNNDSMSA